MQRELLPNRHLQRMGGWSIGLSGLLLGLLSFYLLYLGGLGFKPEMFDNHELLHAWVNEYPRQYQFTWVIYFLAQLCLVGVPYVFRDRFIHSDGNHRAIATISQCFGFSAITLAMLSPIIFYATSPLTAQAYVSATSAEAREMVLLVSSLMTDIPKEIRLFSEILLGIWLVLSSWLFLHASRVDRGIGLLTLVVGAWTLLVATVKIFDPSNPLEDYLGLVFSFAYICIGCHLITRARMASQSALGS